MIKEQNDLIHESIGKIIYKTSKVHFLAAQIISYYYTGNDYNHYRVSFIHDILTNKSTSISFIAESLKRVLLNLNFDKNYTENIERNILTIGNLRNKFAHEVLLFNEGYWFPDRKCIPWHGEGQKFEDEFQKFETLFDKITSELNKIIKDKEIIKIDHIPNGYEPPTERFDLSK